MIECWPGRRTSFLRSGMCVELWSSQGDRERHRVAVGKSACFDVEAVVEIDGVKAGPTRSHIALRNLRVERSKSRTASGASASCASSDSELALVFEKPGRYTLPIQDITKIRCKSLHQGRASIECRDSVFLLSASFQNELEKLLEFVRDARSKNSFPDSRCCATCKEKGERKKAKLKREQQPAVGSSAPSQRKCIPTDVVLIVDCHEYVAHFVLQLEDGYMSDSRGTSDIYGIKMTERTEYLVRLGQILWVLECSFRKKQHPSFVEMGQEQVYLKDLLRHTDNDYLPRKLNKMRSSLEGHDVRSVEVDRVFARQSNSFNDTIWTKDMKIDDKIQSSPERSKGRDFCDQRISSPTRKVMFIDEVLTCDADGPRRREAQRVVNERGNDFQRGIRVQMSENEKENRKVAMSEFSRDLGEDLVTEFVEGRKGIALTRRKVHVGQSKVGGQFHRDEDRKNIESEERRRSEQKEKIASSMESLRKFVQLENKRKDQREMMREYRSNDERKLRNDTGNNKKSLDEWVKEEDRREEDFRKERRKESFERIRQEDKRQRLEEDRKAQEQRRREEEEQNAKELERKLQELKRREEENKRAKEAERKLQELKRREEEDKRVKEAERKLQELTRREEQNKKAKEAERKLQELTRREEEDKKAKEAEWKLQELKRREEEDKKAKEAERKLQDLKRREEEDKKAAEAMRKLHDMKQREKKESDKRCRDADRKMQEQVQEQTRKQIEEKVREALKYFKLEEDRQEMREREEIRISQGAVRSTIRLPQRFRCRVWEEELCAEDCRRMHDAEMDKTELRKFDENMRTWMGDEHNSRAKDSNQTISDQEHADPDLQGLSRSEEVTKTSKRMHSNAMEDDMNSDMQTVKRRSPEGNDDGDCQMNAPSQSRLDSDDDEAENRGFHERVAFLDQFLSFRGIQRARIDEEIRLAKDSERFILPGIFSKPEKSRQEDQKKQELQRKKATKAADEQKKKLAQERLRAAKAEAKRLEKLLKEAQKLAKAQERARQQQKAEEQARRKAAAKGGEELPGFAVGVHQLTYHQYEESWNSIKLSERTSILGYCDIPWPPHDNPLFVEAGDSLVAQRRKLRNALLRWHPDKFLSLCGHRLSPSERDFIEARAKGVAEKVMQWKCKLDNIA